MSLAINIDHVVSVLLGDGDWHDVLQEKGVSTFDTDSYEYVRGSLKGGDFELIVGGGSVAGIPATGARWEEIDRGVKSVVSCPLTSVLAVRVRR
jgi:hypothetical protein